MSWGHKLITIAIVIVVFFALNMVMQRSFPTKASDTFERKVVYRFLVYAAFGALLLAAIFVGFALDGR